MLLPLQGRVLPDDLVRHRARPLQDVVVVRETRDADFRGSVLPLAQQVALLPLLEVQLRDPESVIRGRERLEAWRRTSG